MAKDCRLPKGKGKGGLSDVEVGGRLALENGNGGPVIDDQPILNLSPGEELGTSYSLSEGDQEEPWMMR